MTDLAHHPAWRLKERAPYLQTGNIKETLINLKKKSKKISTPSAFNARRTDICATADFATNDYFML